jgi:hypothetical protein
MQTKKLKILRNVHTILTDYKTKLPNASTDVILLLRVNRDLCE